MNKHQFSAVVIAVLAIAGSLILWTRSVHRIELPEFAEDTVSHVQLIIDKLFSWAGEPDIVAITEVEIKDLGQHFVTTVETSDITASVIPQENRVLVPVHVPETQPEEVLEQEPEEVLEKQEVLKPQEQPVPVHASASELEQWELSRAWNIAIPSLSIRAPIFLPSMKYWATQTWDMLEEQMQVGLNHGAVAYPHSSGPGRKGSLIVAGHSSPPDERSADSSYGHLFAKLPDIDLGQQITVTTAGSPVVYEVHEKIVVSPQMTSILEQQYDESILKIITCYPVGTTKDRMIVLAKKVEE